MLSASCPTCGSTLGVPDEMIGQQVRCGGCQEVFVIEAPPPSRRRDRDNEDDDRPSRRRSRRDSRDDEDDRDRPSRRRSRRDDEDDEDDYYDDRPRKKRKKRRRKEAPGKPGLAVAAAILFLIWGGIGALLTILSIVGLVSMLDGGAPAVLIIESLVSTVLSGCVCGYLISSALRILNGQVDDIASIGVAVLAVTGGLAIWAIVRAALTLPAFALAYVLTGVLVMMVLMSGVILGGIFCIVCSKAYDKWQRS